MKTAAIIVNHNNGDVLFSKVQSTCACSCIDAVIVVDNKSTDNSVEAVAGFDKVTVLYSDKNGGYGYGNNIGLKYADEVLCADYAVISNPDTEFSDDCIREMLRILSSGKDIAVCAPVCRTPESSFESPVSAWPIRSWHNELFEHGPIMRRIFRKSANYPESLFSSRDPVCVGAVLGSCLAVNIKKLREVGCYDENIFLYCEENIIGCKLKEHGCNTMLLCNISYLHNHKPALPGTDQIRTLRDSELYYFENYLHAGFIKMLFSRLFFAIVILESGIINILCRKKS